LEPPKAERNFARRRGLAARARVRVVPGFARVANRGAPVVSLAMAFARDPAVSLAIAIASALIAEPSSVWAPRDVRGCLQGALRSRRGGRGRRRGLTARVDGGARERVVPAEKTVSGRRRTGLRGRLVVRARGGVRARGHNSTGCRSTGPTIRCDDEETIFSLTARDASRRHARTGTHTHARTQK
jgi:hypothetical protein